MNEAAERHKHAILALLYLADILQKLGILRIGRRFLKPNEFSIANDKDGKLRVDLIFGPGQDAVYREVLSRRRSYAEAFLVRGPLCSKCGLSYATCDRSKYFESSVTPCMSDVS